MGREIQENKRKEKSELSINNELIELSVKNELIELSVKNELSELSEENGKYLVGENKKGMSEKKKLEIESNRKDKGLLIHYDYTNNFNLSFSSALKVILEDSMPYKDPFDYVIEITYAYKVKNTFEDFIPQVKLRRKQ